VDKNTEQRKHPRIKTHISMKFRKLRDGAGIQGVSSITKNLSEGGIRFRTADFIAMACRLIVELDIPMLTRPVKAISKVAWIRKAVSGNDYEIGNQFLEMSKEDEKAVSEYICNLDSEDKHGKLETEQAIGSDETL